MLVLIIACAGICLCLCVSKGRRTLNRSKLRSCFCTRRCRESAYPIQTLIYNRERPSICLTELPSAVCTITGREHLEREHSICIDPPELPNCASPTCLEELMSQNSSAMDSGYHSHSSSSAADIISTASSESHLTALEIEDRELYNLKVGTFDFMHPIGVLECGESGGLYHNSTHNFTIAIPQGAIPNDTVIRIEVGVCSYGPFTFPSDHRPLSAIVWLHVQNHKGFQFQKAVKITLQHCINIGKERDCQLLELAFMKANCRADGRSSFEFSPAKGKYHFPVGNDCGTLCTNCFCFACITALFQPETLSKVKYSLVTVEPGLTSNILWSVHFIMCYHLQTCIQVGVHGACMELRFQCLPSIHVV